MVSETWLVYGESTEHWVVVNYTLCQPEFTSAASRDDVNYEKASNRVGRGGKYVRPRES